MARINVEDDLSFDERFKALARRIGDEDKALGMLVRFWRSAQNYWGEEELMPMEIFELGDFEPILSARLAIVEPRGVYAVGAEKRFKWYLVRCRNARAIAAKKAGLPPPVRKDPRTGLPEIDKAPPSDDLPASESETAIDEGFGDPKAELRTSEVMTSDIPLTPVLTPVLENTSNPPKPPLLSRRVIAAEIDKLVAVAVQVGVAACEAYKAGLHDPDELVEWTKPKLQPDPLCELVVGRYGNIFDFLRDVWAKKSRNELKKLERELRDSFRGQLAAATATGPPQKNAEDPVLQ